MQEGKNVLLNDSGLEEKVVSKLFLADLIKYDSTIGVISSFADI